MSLIATAFDRIYNCNFVIPMPLMTGDFDVAFGGGYNPSLHLYSCCFNCCWNCARQWRRIVDGCRSNIINCDRLNCAGVLLLCFLVIAIACSLLSPSATLVVIATYRIAYCPACLPSSTPSRPPSSDPSRRRPSRLVAGAGVRRSPWQACAFARRCSASAVAVGIGLDIGIGIGFALTVVVVVSLAQASPHCAAFGGSAQSAGADTSQYDRCRCQC